LSSVCDLARSISGDQVPASGIDADFLHELVKEDDVAAALRDLLRQTAFDDVDELVDQHLDPLRVVAEHRGGRLEPSDIAVVVRAEDIDREVEAALELVAHVRDVGGEVQVRPVGRTNERAVLVVAVGARARPDRPLGLVGVEARQDLGNVLLDLTLVPPRVDVDAEVGDLAADLPEHVLDGIDPERSELIDVLALITALG
jgi:hypothetical protein